MAISMPKFHSPRLWCIELPLEKSCLDKDYIFLGPLASRWGHVMSFHYFRG